MCKNCDYASGPDNPSRPEDPPAEYCAWCGWSKPAGVHKCQHCGGTSTVAVPSDG